MRNIKLILEYDGSRYQGWQRPGKDSNTGTVSEKLINVIHQMIGEVPELFCAARTEAGVHALAQTVNFKTDSSLSLTEMKTYINHYLPQDIVVLSIEEISERFHSTLNVKSMTYLYRIQIGKSTDVFRRKYAYYQSEKPDLELIKQAAANLIGRHDFVAFSSGKRKKGTVKELFSLDITENNDEIHFLMKGNNFLHQMPQAIIATLLDIGYEKRPVDCVTKILDKEEKCSPLVPAYGLHLKEIEY